MRLTASSVWLAHKCLWPFRPELPDPPRVTNAKMERGTAMHRLIERMILDGSQGVVAPATLDPKDVAACGDAHDWAMAKFGGMSLRTEVAYGWDPFAGGAAFPKVVERDYSSVPFSYTPGTIDLLALSPDSAVIVDWKTGYSSFDYSAQIEFLGLAVADAVGLDEVTVILAKMSPKGLEPQGWDLGRKDLDQIAARHMTRLAVLDGAQPERGDHCRLCNYRGHGCPAWEAAA
jgi:hypothetical protein